MQGCCGGDAIQARVECWKRQKIQHHCNCSGCSETVGDAEEARCNGKIGFVTWRCNCVELQQLDSVDDAHSMISKGALANVYRFNLLRGLCVVVFIGCVGRDVSCVMGALLGVDDCIVTLYSGLCSIFLCTAQRECV